MIYKKVNDSSMARIVGAVSGNYDGIYACQCISCSSCFSSSSGLYKVCPGCGSRLPAPYIAFINPYKCKCKSALWLCYHGDGSAIVSMYSISLEAAMTKIEEDII